jgi:hypothetical protein
VIVTWELQEEELEKYTIVEEELFLSSWNSENLEQKIEEIPKLEIELQGKIGSNKILNWNKLTCIKTCSVNFDWSKSVWKFSVYFWDFWNGETFEWKNPWYISYENFWEYMVLFSGETKEWSLYEEEFYINFVEKESSTKEEKVELNLINLSFADDEETEILAEFWWIDYNEDEENRNEENGKHFWKYIILVMIILWLLWGFALLRRYDILKK